MVGAWVWNWLRYLVWREERRGEMLWVNAAMREDGENGEDGRVVEI
jgi:hypothetical protein